MLNIIIVSEDEDVGEQMMRYYRCKYSIVPASCFIREAFIDPVLSKVRQDKLTVHAVIDVNGYITMPELQELLDNEVEYYFIPNVEKPDMAKSFASCDHPL